MYKTWMLPVAFLILQQPAMAQEYTLGVGRDVKLLKDHVFFQLYLTHLKVSTY